MHTSMLDYSVAVIRGMCVKVHYLGHNYRYRATKVDVLLRIITSQHVDLVDRTSIISLDEKNVAILYHFELLINER